MAETCAIDAGGEGFRGFEGVKELADQAFGLAFQGLRSAIGAMHPTAPEQGYATAPELTGVMYKDKDAPAPAPQGDDKKAPAPSFWEAVKRGSNGKIDLTAPGANDQISTIRRRLGR
jgi:hypothetical protein